MRVCKEEKKLCNRNTRFNSLIYNNKMIQGWTLHIFVWSIQGEKPKHAPLLLHLLSLAC